MMALLVADRAGFRIGDRAIVQDATLGLMPATVSVIIGPNGAGKSTLLRLLTGEARPTSGSVRLDGEPLAAIPPWRLACRRAVMMQAARLAFPFRAHEVVALGAAGVGRALRRAALDGLVASALDAADAAHLAGRDYQTLSGGEQQRVQFARALAQLVAGRSAEQQQVLFLDEPVSSLDLRHQLALLDAARDLAAGGTAVLAVLHDLNLALAYADHLIVMDAGRIVAQGEPAAVIGDALLRGVFGVDLSLGTCPPAGVPFLLPQMHRRAARRAASTAA
jgi:iron complex transport system ATP-binding protein